MATYFIVNLLFVAAWLFVFRIKLRKPSKAWMLTLLALIILTALFDSIIVQLGIVSYDRDKIFGIYLGAAPIEDFFYSLLAATLVPTVWKLLGGENG